MRNALDLGQWKVCQQRGHEFDGRGITEGMGPTWGYCKWCGIRFRFTEPEMVEHDDDLERIDALRVDELSEERP